jgi:hypothetical protein
MVKHVLRAAPQPAMLAPAGVPNKCRLIPKNSVSSPSERGKNVTLEDFQLTQ